MYGEPEGGISILYLSIASGILTTCTFVRAEGVESVTKKEVWDTPLLYEEQEKVLTVFGICAGIAVSLSLAVAIYYGIRPCMASKPWNHSNGKEDEETCIGTLHYKTVEDPLVHHVLVIPPQKEERRGEVKVLVEASVEIVREATATGTDVKVPLDTVQQGVTAAVQETEM